MAEVCKWYQKGKENVYLGEFGNLESVTLKAVLLTSSYSPNQQTHEHWSDVKAYEVTGSGYVADGATLAGVAVTSSTLVIKIDATDLAWAASTITARYLVIVRMAAAALADTDHLLCYVDFGANKSSSSSTFPVVWASGGILDDTVA